jgi:hypothetical protein
MSEEIYLADQAFGAELVQRSPDIYNGYRAWAEIVVDWMDGHGPKMMPWMSDEEFSAAAKKWSTTWAVDIATPWAEEMAYVMGKKPTGSLTGRMITAAGIPIRIWLKKQWKDSIVHALLTNNLNPRRKPHSHMPLCIRDYFA